MAARAALSPTPAAEPTFEGRVCRLRRGAVTEVYELRADGLAQSFELARRPGDGDLVVAGRLDAPLFAAERAPVHGGIAFHDDRGRPVLEYGAAVVIDVQP